MTLLVVVVAHMGSYLNNPTQALPNLTPLALHTFGFCVTAVAVVLADRETWRLGTEQLRCPIPSDRSLG
jgi:hypothetical protein